jgi:hypothetical protein
MNLLIMKIQPASFYVLTPNQTLQFYF